MKLFITQAQNGLLRHMAICIITTQKKVKNHKKMIHYRLNMLIIFIVYDNFERTYTKHSKITHNRTIKLRDFYRYSARRPITDLPHYFRK